MTQFEADDVFEGAFLLLVLLWGLYIMGESITYDEFFAQAFPLVVSVPMVVLIVLVFGSWYNEPLRHALSKVELDQSINIDDVARSPSLREIAIFVGTTVLYIALAVTVGFFVAMAIYLFVFFRLYDCYDRRKAVVVTVIVWILTSFLLGTVFDIPGIDFGPFSEVTIF